MGALPRLVLGIGLPACLSTACGGDLSLPSSDEPARLLVVSGDRQSVLGGQWAPQPLVVRVLDMKNLQPLPGVPIAYRFAGDVPGSAIDPESVETDAGGEASADVRLGFGTGEQLVVARIEGGEPHGLHAFFRLTALPPGGNADDQGGGGGDGRPGGDGHGDDDDDEDADDEDDDRDDDEDEEDEEDDD